MIKFPSFLPAMCFQQDRDAQKMSWITKFVDELKNDKWVLPALKQIREICQLFPEVRLRYL